MSIRWLFLVAAVATIGAGCDGTVGVEEPVGPAPTPGKADSTCGMASAQTKNLTARVMATPERQHVGGAISDALATEMFGATLVSERTYPRDGLLPDGIIGGGARDYATPDGWLGHEWFVYEGGLREEYVRVYDAGASMPFRAHSDFDGDGRVDLWSDHRLGQYGQTEEDTNNDGRIDRLAQTVATLEGFVIEGYAQGWVPPRFPAMRILEDGDFDGFFDEESITGGDDPNGDSSWWSHNCE